MTGVFEIIEDDSLILAQRASNIKLRCGEIEPGDAPVKIMRHTH